MSNQISIREKRANAANTIAALIIQAGDIVRAASTPEESLKAFTDLEDALVQPLCVIHADAVTLLMGHFRSLAQPFQPLLPGIDPDQETEATA